MGTSSLYKGPKITSLLPSDYNPDVNPELRLNRNRIILKMENQMSKRTVNQINLLSNGAQYVAR